jgi:hypothetical protein
MWFPFWMFWSSEKRQTQVYRKPTHTGWYLNFKSNHPPHVKRGLIQSLHNRASTIWQDRQDLAKEINNLKHDLQLNSYPQGFIDSIINPKGSSSLWALYMYIPYVKGVSEKFKSIGNRYIKTIFRTKHTLRRSLMKTRPEKDPQQCVYSIPCECGRSYIGKPGRPLAVRLREHRHNLKQGLLKKSKLAKHAYKEGRKVGWDKARILDIERHSKYRRYKDPISQTSSDISPIWIPIISNEVNISQRRSIWHDKCSFVSIRF